MESSHRPKRTSNACQRCRSRKVKCSGSQPCDKCCQRREDCVFEEDRKIVVSEELFLSLKRKVEALESQSSSSAVKRRRTLTIPSINDSSFEHPPEPQEATPDPTESTRYDDRFASNPLVSPAGYVKHTGPQPRTWLFLGPTSTWSFSRRVLNIVQAQISPDSSQPIPLAVDGDAYQVQWRHASSDEHPDISGLPSLEHALYMVSTVQFHFSHLYRLFDEEDFLHHLYEFYDDAATKVQESRLWYVQFLVILAFGEAFLDPLRKAPNTASWTRYFSRAMSLLPDITGLWQNPTLAIEVLALIALYFHSVDMRDTAYCYIGHSMRMALVEGFHRAQPVEQLGQKLVNRWSNIWWTVYILDRQFSSLIGSPNSVRDDEITSFLWDPQTCSQNEAALGLHVKITQVISRVLNTVYSADGTLGGAFLRKVRSVLHEVTTLSRELDEVFSHRFASSVDALSGVTTRLILSCHLCIIVTTRPLVLSLLWERLSCFEAGTEFRTLSPPVQALLQACTDSALKSLKILTALRDQRLLETFLPFDLETLFSSGFILSLVSAILPDTVPDPSHRDTSYSLLNAMIDRGNRVAQLRKSEIELLEDLIQPLVQRQTGPRYHRLTPARVSDLPETGGAGAGLPPPPVLSEEDDLPLDWRGFGLSLDCMISATDLLSTEHLVLDAERGGEDLWLWDS
ncbi:C6 transcription factor [Aspergillus heteromorphus CBS 117.55]|uniref:C6 transcription factor n=1 Tax=Aspergillus heteromorphus CBS 117.55 TaxID=1448321 RepID=A0A317WJW6_9EURO|nr:C6 transcription factor [Aspergillus heteromorphus CBS 117.55]PWY86744.1 C6 transcription factor [Aspergillus heteromorphus CBS 117.55]